MICIDGSYGEGGGQILRTSLALSLLTGKAFEIRNIRSKRRKPGLMRQHLTALEAAQKIGNAKVQGGGIGSGTVTFVPGMVQPGYYHFSVGTAGSCTLVLQTVLPALLTAEGESELLLEGGTHNPFAPPFDFLNKAFLPLVNQMGAEVRALLFRPGFYPAGGGKFRISVRPAKKLMQLHLKERGEILSQSARAIVAKLPRHIAERELGVIQKKLSWPSECLHIEESEDSHGPGNIVFSEVESEHVTEIFTGFGERGVTAERVAEKVVKSVREYVIADVPVGPYLADQLLIPLAMAGGGSFLTLAPTLHTTTNMEIIRKFLDVEFRAEQLESGAWEIRIHA